MLRFVNIGLKNILFRVSFFRIEIFTFFIVFAVNLQKIGLLNRFPWQDLIYSDFQIYNKWRWFKDSLNQLGIFYGLSNSIDFTRNFGENTYLTSRTASPLFDLGSIGYEITGNLQIAIVFKFGTSCRSLLFTKVAICRIFWSTITAQVHSHFHFCNRWLPSNFLSRNRTNGSLVFVYNSSLAISFS